MDGEKQWGSWIRADVPRRDGFDKSNVGGWSTPVVAGSGSSGGWRSFQPESHVNADVGESQTPRADHGAVSAGDCGAVGRLERGVGRVVSHGEEYRVGVAVERGKGHAAIRGGDGGVTGEAERGLRSADVRGGACRGVHEQLPKQVGHGEVDGIQPTLAHVLGSTHTGTSSTIPATTNSAGVRASESRYEEETKFADASRHVEGSLVGDTDPSAMLAHAKFGTLHQEAEGACTPMGLDAERRPETPTPAPMAVSTQEGSTLRGWKRQARASRINVAVQPVVGGHKRKSSVQVHVGRKGAMAAGKRGKKDHMFSLTDMDELAEADIQLRQQP
jgi:hypothetical protein